VIFGSVSCFKLVGGREDWKDCGLVKRAHNVNEKLLLIRFRRENTDVLAKNLLAMEQKSAERSTWVFSPISWPIGSVVFEQYKCTIFAGITG
jgi:hypothetical protein